MKTLHTTHLTSKNENHRAPLVVAKEATLRVKRRKPRTAKIGVFGVGHYRYWSQFHGLQDEMLHKLDVFIGKLEKLNVEVSNFGLIDEAKGAYALVPPAQGGQSRLGLL